MGHVQNKGEMITFRKPDAAEVVPCGLDVNVFKSVAYQNSENFSIKLTRNTKMNYYICRRPNVLYAELTIKDLTASE